MKKIIIIIISIFISCGLNNEEIKELKNDCMDRGLWPIPIKNKVTEKIISIKCVEEDEYYTIKKIR